MECQIVLDEIAELSCLYGLYECGEQIGLCLNCVESLFFMSAIFVGNTSMQLEHVLKCLPTADVDVEVHVKDALDVALWEATLEGWLYQLLSLFTLFRI